MPVHAGPDSGLRTVEGVRVLRDASGRRLPPLDAPRNATTLDRIGAAVARAAGESIDLGQPLPASGRRTRTLRVVCWNIHSCLGPRGVDRLGDARRQVQMVSAVADALMALDPDVALLQEVQHCDWRNGRRDQFARLVYALSPSGAAWAPPGRYASGRAQGTAVLTFRGARVADARSLHATDPYGEHALRRAGGRIAAFLRMRGSRQQLAQPRAEPRAPRSWLVPFFLRNVCDTLVVLDDDAQLRVTSSHLSGGLTRWESHFAQLAAVTTAFDSPLPTIYGGDFNLSSSGKRYTRERDLFAERGLHNAFERAGIDPADERCITFPSPPRPRGGYDRLYVSDHVAVESIDVDATFDAVSDHRPIVAVVRCTPCGARSQ